MALIVFLHFSSLQSIRNYVIRFGAYEIYKKNFYNNFITKLRPNLPLVKAELVFTSQYPIKQPTNHSTTWLVVGSMGWNNVCTKSTKDISKPGPSLLSEVTEVEEKVHFFFFIKNLPHEG